MGRARDIPVIRASIFEPVLVAARKIGVPLERYLRLAGLPTTPCEEPDRILPEIPTWRFVNSVAQTQGIMTLGIFSLDIIRMFELSSLKPLIAGSKNLNELLQHMCIAAPLMSNSASYRLEILGDLAVFSNRGLRLMSDDTQAQLFQIFGMIQLIQLAAGPDWRPEVIHFTIPRSAEIERAPQLNPSRIRFSQRVPGIAFSRYLLPSAVHLPNSKQSDVSPIPATFSEQLQQVLAPYMGETSFDKAFAAEIAGMSPRTLQRRLDEEHTSFVAVLERLRLQKAQALLEDPDVKLIEIAFELGYENPPSFTRAFRRWTGVTPSEYRHRLLIRPPTAANAALRR